MFFRLLPVALAPFALALSFATTGCASDTDGDDTVVIDEASVTSLRSVTAFAGGVKVEASTTVDYRKEDFLGRGFKTIPFLAYEITAEGTIAAPPPGVTTKNGTTLGATQTVTVQGPFPSTPRVLVVDESFKVLASANAAPQADGSALATLESPKTTGRRFVLVRDGRWSLPMSFDIRVGR